MKKPDGNLSHLRRLFFILIIFLGVLLLLEVGLRAAKAPVFRPVVKTASSSGGSPKYKFPYHPRLPGIAIPKAGSVMRIVIAGESAANGWPFEGAGFPEQMGAMLSGLQKGETTYEVINLSMNGINSDFLKEILRDALPVLAPDVLIIYAGNNEILAQERLDDLRHPRLKAGIWQLRRHSRLWNLPSSLSGWFVLHGAAVHLMLHIARMDDAHAKPLNPASQRDHARQLYLHHLRQIIALAREQNVPVVLTTVGANLRDWIPMKAVHSLKLDDTQVEQIHAELEKARHLLRSGNTPAALPLLQQITTRDPDYAKGWFFLGRAELFAGETAAGRAHLAWAVELADFFQQVPPSWNEDIRHLAAETNTPLVDIEKILAEHAPHHVPGFELFLDGCHPTLHGHYVIASALLRSLSELGFLPSRFTAQPLPSEEKTIASLHLPPNYLPLSLFNQAMVLALLYLHPEYKTAARDYLEEAMQRGLSPVVGGTYAGYFSILLDRPDEAALSLSRARNAAPELFAAIIKKKLGPVMVLHDPWLMARKIPAEDLAKLYPAGDVPVTLDLALSDSPYRFYWEGNAYRFVPEEGK